MDVGAVVGPRMVGAGLELGESVGVADGAPVGLVERDGDNDGAFVVGLSDVGAGVAIRQVSVSSSHAHVGNASLHPFFSETSMHSTLVLQNGSPPSPLTCAIHSQCGVERQSYSPLDLDDRASQAIRHSAAFGDAVGAEVIGAASSPPSSRHHSQPDFAASHSSSEVDSRKQSTRASSVGLAVGVDVEMSPSPSSEACFGGVLEVGSSAFVVLAVVVVLREVIDVVFAPAVRVSWTNATRNRRATDIDERGDLAAIIVVVRIVVVMRRGEQEWDACTFQIFGCANKPRA